MNTLTETNVRLFASAKSWIEGEALRQLYAAAKLEGMRLAVGFPDLHPGKGSPVGAAFVTEGLIYPYLIGGDIGCGMALFKTDLVRRDVKLDRWADLRFDLEHRGTDEVQKFSPSRNLSRRSSTRPSALSVAATTSPSCRLLRRCLNAGNSSASAWASSNWLCWSTAARADLGESILRDYVDEHQASGSDAESFAAAAYLQGHDLAVRWAKVNRRAPRSALRAAARCRSRPALGRLPQQHHSP